MISLQTAVRVSPHVSRHFVQLRGVTKTTNVVSTPPSVKISFAVCDINNFCINCHSRCVVALGNLGRMCFLIYKIHCMLSCNT